MAEQQEMILRAVLQIIEEDYAGQPECSPRNDAPQWLAALASARTAGTLDDELFIQYMNCYLMGFQDPNLSFEATNEAQWEPYSCGFSVRRYQDELFVVDVCEDDRFTAGDAIVLLNESKPADYLSTMWGNSVKGDDPERQLWDEVLAGCSWVRVRHADGSEEKLSIKKFPKPPFAARLQPPTVAVIDGVGRGKDERAVVVTVHHFVDGSMLELLQQHYADIVGAQRVIIDVRDVEEGMIGNAYGLLALFFNQAVNLKELMGQESLFTRYTKRNAQLRLRQLSRMLNMSDASGKGWVQAEIDHVAACSGQGFVEEAEFEEDMLFPPAPEGLQVFLLTDVYTRGPGERLVAIAQRAAGLTCGIVRCVGRATRGGLDYSNLIAVALDERFSLVYPISKTRAAHQGQGMLGRGIAPDVYVGFTSEECTRDLVLEKALNL